MIICGESDFHLPAYGQHGAVIVKLLESKYMKKNYVLWMYLNNSKMQLSCKYHKFANTTFMTHPNVATLSQGS